MKKFISLIVAAIMLVASMPAAFAANQMSTPANTSNTVVPSTVELPAIGDIIEIEEEPVPITQLPSTVVTIA